MQGGPKAGPAAGVPRALQFTGLNWTLLAAAAVLIVVGYSALAGGSTVIAPVLLVVAYAVLIPLGIIL